MIKFISRLVMLACFVGSVTGVFSGFLPPMSTPFMMKRGQNIIQTHRVLGCTKVRFPLVMKKSGSSVRRSFD